MLHLLSRLAIAILAVGALAGCSGSGEVSAAEDQQLRANFKRTMSDEEVAKLKGQKPASTADPNAPPAGASAPATGPAGTSTD